MTTLTGETITDDEIRAWRKGYSDAEAVNSDVQALYIEAIWGDEQRQIARGLIAMAINARSAANGEG